MNGATSTSRPTIATANDTPHGRTSSRKKRIAEGDPSTAPSTATWPKNQETTTTTKTTKKTREVQGWQRRLQEAKQRRQENNRKHARDFRRRQREKLEHIMKQCSDLEEENRKLRVQLRVGEESHALLQAQQEEAIRKIESVLQSGATNLDMLPIMDEFADRFCDWGEDRPSSLDFHARTIGSQLGSTPDVYTSSVNLLLSAVASEVAKDTETTHQQQQPDDRFLSSSLLSDQDLCSQLIQHLELDSNQVHHLQQLAAWETATLSPASSSSSQQEVVKEFRQNSTLGRDALRDLIKKAKEFVPPRTGAGIVLWISKNSACMHMLNELWVKIYKQAMEQAVSTPTDNAIDIDEETEFEDESDTCDDKEMMEEEDEDAC